MTEPLTLVAGVKVATQTPPIRSGRRVVFLTLDDSTGPVDATFFEDVQGPYAATAFHSWLLLVRGRLRRTGQRGVSLRATGAWELTELWQKVQDLLAANNTAGERKREHPHYLKGTVFCGTCGSRLVVSHAKNRHGTVYEYFICLGRQQKRTGCTQARWPAESRTTARTYPEVRPAIG